MRVREKIWQTEYQGINILVKNIWGLERTIEEISINGKQIQHRETPIIGTSPVSSLLGWQFFYEENGTKITIKIGSAWHLCGLACQVLINGKYYYGNRIVLFAKKCV